MKFHPIITLAALLGLLAGESYAAGSHTTPCYFDGKTLNVDSGCKLQVKSGGILQLDSGSSETNSATKTSGGNTDVSGIVFSNSITGNPLSQVTEQDLPIASVNASVVILSGIANKKIYPGGGIDVMAGGGNAAGGTSIVIACSGGNKLATWPIATLVSGIPVNAFVSTNLMVTASAMTTGCPAGQSVMASAVGTITTATDFFVNMPYTIQ